ncbi:MAG: tRNA (N(6)-L-threonylcarbamoyladenosine(37)-C(2))-methylthiotransferase MtaB [Bacteroidota bacterium]|nr:tRNA (N(6)-L-threonylcarbamoyladenosine(37)-C(2))-methylthiotransferase MtaB [Bacteroidota bacterium]
MINKNDKKVAFYTLGCKLNYAETSNIARILNEGGYQKVNFQDNADFYVINTCAVTGNAEKKCRNIIRQTIRRSPTAKIIIMGCFSQLAHEEIKNIEGVSLVLGNSEKSDIIKYMQELDNDTNSLVSCNDILKIDEFYPSYSSGDRTRAFLKIQDGCDYYCSYCTVPLARGHSRSGRIEDIVNSAIEIGKKGIKEIVLTGVNIGDFGKNTGEKFIELLRKLEDVKAIERYRISSIEPNLITEEIINHTAISRKFLPHFHIPLQSGTDKILKAMKRRYDTKFFSEKVSLIKKQISDCCIAVDVIAGFPGETEKDFEETYNFINSLDISYVHVFTYSERANTLATDFENKVSISERHKRTKALLELSEIKKKEFYLQHIGQSAKVLFESENENGFIGGFSENYIRIKVPYTHEFVNKILELTIKEENLDL